jgi:hypothetical protein
MYKDPGENRTYLGSSLCKKNYKKTILSIERFLNAVVVFKMLCLEFPT